MVALNATLSAILQPLALVGSLSKQMRPAARLACSTDKAHHQKAVMVTLLLVSAGSCPAELTRRHIPLHSSFDSSITCTCSSIHPAALTRGNITYKLTSTLSVRSTTSSPADGMERGTPARRTTCDCTFQLRTTRWYSEPPSVRTLERPAPTSPVAQYRKQ
jgi:hypothetical protein